MDVTKVYEYALMREREGMRFFRENAERVSHASAAGILRQLAEEEERHIRFIESLLGRLKDATASDPPLDSLPKENLFTDRANVEHLDQTIIESMIPDVAILRTAYLIERDFAEFYEHAADATKDAEAAQALRGLAKWERQHETMFKNLHDRVLEEYGQMPWGG